MSHEQSETIQGKDGKWYNVYGRGTAKAGQVLPDEPAYDTVEMATRAAQMRSEAFDSRGASEKMQRNALAKLLQRAGVPAYPSNNLREPYPSEEAFFAQNPSVAGMATEDDRVILNQGSNLTPEQQAAVYQNEMARLQMRGQNPWFDVTDEQRQNLAGTEYVKPGNEAQLRQTIMARLLSGDKSAGTPTPMQSLMVNTATRR